MRVGELVNLTRDQIRIKSDTKDLEISIIGKGSRPRTVYISERALYWLKKYLATRQDKEKALFINYKGKKPVTRLTIRSIERIVKKYAIIAGLPFSTVCHTLRHSFATDLLRKGVDLRVVQEFLGHKNIVTTQIYTHITKPHLREIHRKFHGKKN
jgi:site-specific recombinase XerD